MISRRIGVRLALWHLVILLVSAFTAFGAAYLLLVRGIDEQTQDVIDFRLQQFAQEYNRAGTAGVIDLTTNRRGRAQKAFFVRVHAPNGATIFLRDPLDWEEFRPNQIVSPRKADRNWVRVKGSNEELRVGTLELPDGNFLQVGRTTELRDEVRQRFWITAGLQSLVLVIAGALGGVFLARRAFAPIQRITETVRAIMETRQFSARVPSPGSRDEIDELISCLNTMLGRIDVLIRGMGDALDNVAHDLRTPMTRLRNIAQSALENEADHQRAQEALADCLEESDRVLTMLHTLMDISEAQAGMMHLSRRAVQLESLIDAVVDLYQDVADEKRVSLVASTGIRASVSGDVVRLRSALANLVDNAIKYTPEGGSVTVASAASPTGAPQLIVEDTGMGIPAAEQDKIWDRLYRGDKSRSQRGLGLGLSFVKAIVEAHAGKVTVDSVPGAGARFTIELPALESARAVSQIH